MPTNYLQSNRDYQIRHSSYLFLDYSIKMKDSKQRKYDIAYLRMAQEWSKLSYCKRRQVGALIVKDKMIISDGYNGTPTGFENICEDDEGYTKWYVLHAEANAILKVASSTQACQGATLYITMSPCKECSKLIHQAGITRMVYLNEYKDNSGIVFLEKAGVSIQHISDLNLE
ncbi:tRNA-specific adenosine deaminase [Aequorivita lipolytica]|nr:tRNA-specific adenosine deaminase [Aequorivita lipolytica]